MSRCRPVPARIFLSGLSTAAVLIALACLPLAAHSTTPPNRQLNDSTGDPSFATESAPVIRSLGDKVVALWYDVQTGSGTEQRIQYAVSTDSGATFADLGALPPPVTTGTWRWRTDPQLAVDAATGAFFAAGQVVFGSGRLGIAVVKGTFSGSTLTWGAPVVVREFVAPTNLLRIGSLGFDAASAGGSLHLLFANYYTASGIIEYQRSVDGNGAVWSAPITLSSVSDAGGADLPRLVPGLNNDLHSAWCGALGVASEPIRYRSSADLGVTWGAEQTVATMRMNPVVSGQVRLILRGVARTGFSMAVNRVASSATLGRIAFAYGESWDFSDEPFPPLTGSLLRDENEPNNTAGTAQAFSPGDVLQGTIPSLSDVDLWAVTLAAGQSLLLWADSTGTNLQIDVEIVGPDGAKAIATGLDGPPPAAFAFRAPAAGTFYVRVQAPFSGLAGTYRVRTRTSTPSPGEARDMRDPVFVYSTPSGWSSPVRPEFGPIGYDDYLPTIGFAADGLDYSTWYDFGRVGGFGGVSHLVAARNLVGSDPVPSPPATVTDVATDWDPIEYVLPGALGTSNDVSADARRVHFAWTDSRSSNPDAFATSLATTAVLGPCPSDTTVAAGTTPTLRIGLYNPSLLFEEKAIVHVSGARAWPGALAVRDSVPALASGTLDVPIDVPDSAAAGVYPLTLTVERQSGISLGTCNVALTIQPAVAVEGGPRGFGLEPIVPSPALRAARIRFTIPSAGQVRVAVYGMRGNLVRTLTSGERPAGPGSLVWDGLDHAQRRVAAGVYVVVLESGPKRASRALVILQ